MGVVKELSQNDPALRLISSKGTLARNIEINIEIDATKIHNTGRKKKSTHETEKRKKMLLGQGVEETRSEAPTVLWFTVPRNGTDGGRT